MIIKLYNKIKDKFKSKDDEVITKVEVYEMVRLTMNNLEKANDDIQDMRDELYRFLDKHYDLSKFKSSHLQ